MLLYELMLVETENNDASIRTLGTFKTKEEMADWLAHDFRGGVGLDEDSIVELLRDHYYVNWGTWGLCWRELEQVGGPGYERHRS